MNPISRLLGHWLSCKNASRLMSQLQDRAPTGFEETRLRWHLAACDACTRLEKQMGFLRQAMRRYRS